MKRARTRPPSGATPRAAPSPSAYTSVAGFDRLPNDLLRALLRLIPRRPRLLVCALVCKRWHTAALQTIDTIILTRPVLRSFPLASLPCLTDLSIMDTFSARGLELPTTLRALRLREASQCLCALFNRLKNLELISLELETVCACWHRIILRNAATIRSLLLAVVPDAKPARGEPLTLTLPALESLTLVVGGSDVQPSLGALSFQTLLSAHLSQLTHLALGCAHRYPDDDPNPAYQLQLESPMPRLADVRLVNTALEGDYIARLLTHAPALTALSVSTVGEVSDPLLLRAADKLAELRIDEEIDLEACNFTGFTRLTSLFMNLGSLHLEQYAHLAPHLSFWMAWATARCDASVLRTFTALRSLTLRLLGNVAEFDLSVLPPSLTSLGLLNDDRDTTARVVCKALAACPHLQHVCLLQLPTQVQDADALCDALQRGGVTRLSFVHDDNPETYLQALRRRYAWLDVRTRDSCLRTYHLKFLEAREMYE